MRGASADRVERARAGFSKLKRERAGEVLQNGVWEGGQSASFAEFVSSSDIYTSGSCANKLRRTGAGRRGGVGQPMTRQARSEGREDSTASVTGAKPSVNPPPPLAQSNPADSP